MGRATKPQAFPCRNNMRHATKVVALPRLQQERRLPPGQVQRDLGKARHPDRIPLHQDSRRFIDPDADIRGRRLDERQQIRFPLPREQMLVDDRALHETQALRMVSDRDLRPAGIATPKERALDAGASRRSPNHPAPLQQGVQGVVGARVEIDFGDAPLASAGKENAVCLCQGGNQGRIVGLVDVSQVKAGHASFRNPVAQGFQRGALVSLFAAGSVGNHHDAGGRTAGVAHEGIPDLVRNGASANDDEVAFRRTVPGAGMAHSGRKNLGCGTIFLRGGHIFGA